VNTNAKGKDRKMSKSTMYKASIKGGGGGRGNNERKNLIVIDKRIFNYGSK